MRPQTVYAFSLSFSERILIYQFNLFVSSFFNIAGERGWINIQNYDSFSMHFFFLHLIFFGGGGANKQASELCSYIYNNL